LSPSSSVLLLAKTITHPAARSLCDSWASCSYRKWPGYMYNGKHPEKMSVSGQLYRSVPGPSWHL